MTREDLFRAIGEVEESRLARCENLRASNVNILEVEKMNRKRITLRLVLIAAIVACLAFSALASEYLLGGRIEGSMHTGVIHYSDGRLEEREDFEWDVYLDFEVEESLVVLEEYYIPTAMNDEMVGYYAWIEDGITTFTIVEENRKDSLEFKQWNTSHYEPGEPVYSLMGSPECEPTSSFIRWGDREYFLVNDSGVCYLFWSDGRYLFYLRFDGDIVKLDRVREIVESLTPVDSLEPYMRTP